MKGSKAKATSSRRAENKLAVKSNGASSKVTKKGKAAKDPNKPKRPPTAFFIFMEDYRKQYKERYPENKSVAMVSKSGGEKWKTMSEDEKAPFIANANKRKAEYIKVLQAYEDEQVNGVKADVEDDGSDKSKSEVNDDGNGDESGEEEDDD